MNHFGLATPPQKFPLFWLAVLGREKAAIGMLIFLQLPTVSAPAIAHRDRINGREGIERPSTVAATAVRPNAATPVSI